MIFSDLIRYFESIYHCAVTSKLLVPYLSYFGFGRRIRPWKLSILYFPSRTCVDVMYFLLFKYRYHSLYLIRVTIYNKSNHYIIYFLTTSHIILSVLTFKTYVYQIDFLTIVWFRVYFPALSFHFRCVIIHYSIQICI